MLEVVFIALASIALGALIGLWPGTGSGAASPFGTFAIVTAVAVVLGQLLPEALASLGIMAFVPFVVGFALPRLIERTVTAITKQPTCTHEDAMCTDLGLEIGYVGLLLHRVGDGVGLGLYGGPMHAGHGHYDVIFAIAGHTVPVTAVVLLAFKTHRGTMSAAIRAAGIVLSTLVGIGAASALPVGLLTAAEPWVSAGVGGLLMHIVTHGWTRVKPTLKTRLTDLFAIAAGLAIVGLGGHSHATEKGLPDVRHAMGEARWELGLETAPMLLLGLGIAALLQTQGDRGPARCRPGGGHTRPALRGALLGMPLPVCACGILPVAHTLKVRGAAPALVVAFLLATPELGVETFALTVRFLGWEFALMRLAGAMIVAVVAALMLAHFAPPPPAAAPTGSDRAMSRADGRSLRGRVLGHFDELLYHVGAWTLVGLLAAAYVQATLTDGALQSIAGSGLDVLVISALAVPSYVCASSATPLAAVLLAKGVSPGAVLAGLLLGPATNLATVAWLRKAFGPRATLFAIGGLLGATWALAAVSNSFLHEPLSSVARMEPHEHGPVSIISASILGMLFLRAVWRNGLQAWLGSLGEALADESTPHAHAHAHHHEGGAAHS